VRTRSARRLANGIVLATLAFLAASSALELSGGAVAADGPDAVFMVVNVVASATYLLIGRAIVTRQPENTIGWLLMAIPLVASFGFVNGDYSVRGLVDTADPLPFARVSAWVDSWTLVPMLAVFIPLFLLFPNGRLPSPRWRWVLIATVTASAVTTIGIAITPGRLTGGLEELGPAAITNPFGIDALAGVIETVTTISGFTTLATAIAACAALVVRFRGATADVRQQIRWLALVGVAFVAQLGATIAGAILLSENDVIGNVLFATMFGTLVLGIPAACGVAILRYRLYELDVVIRKAVIAATLAAFIGLVYVGIVSGVGALIGSEREGALAFAATAVLAIAFQPARDRARRLADRLVYGTRATPYEVLAEFSERAGDAYASDDVLPRMAEIVGRGVGADLATVWLRVGGELRPAASWPVGELGGGLPLRGGWLPSIEGHAVEVRHRDELLGAIAVSMPPDDPMDPAKERLIEDLAAQARLVLRNVRLVEELRASRQRLVAAQDEERRKLERNLHDGAQQQLVALQVQLRLAEQLAGTDPDRERKALHRLQGAAAHALDDLRDLARGIYPPLLADQGLPAALEAQARRASIPVEVDPDGVDRYERDIEAAAYFCALEALNNIAKYANATHATIRLAHEDDSLVFEVRDDGRGFDPEETGYGTGLQGMADRLDAIGGSLDVMSTPGNGTTVRGRMPVSSPADRAYADLADAHADSSRSGPKTALGM
jgi:signal transduction histidine kinase